MLRALALVLAVLALVCTACSTAEPSPPPFPPGTPGDGRGLDGLDTAALLDLAAASYQAHPEHTVFVRSHVGQRTFRVCRSRTDARGNIFREDGPSADPEEFISVETSVDGQSFMRHDKLTLKIRYLPHPPYVNGLPAWPPITDPPRELKAAAGKWIRINPADPTAEYRTIVACPSDPFPYHDYTRGPAERWQDRWVIPLTAQNPAPSSPPFTVQSTVYVLADGTPLPVRMLRIISDGRVVETLYGDYDAVTPITAPACPCPDSLDLYRAGQAAAPASAATHR